MSRPISASYLERKLRAIVGVQGSNPLPDLDDVGKGLIVLEGDRPEWRLPGGEYLWGIERSPAAGGAGTFGYVAVRVPLAAGVISVVTKIVIANNTATQQYLVIGMAQNAAVLNDGIVFPRDARNLQTIPGTRRDTGNPAAPVAVNELLRVNVPPGSTLVLDNLDFILAASVVNQGPGIYVQELNGNVTINVGIAGYERPVEGGVEIR